MPWKETRPLNEKMEFVVRWQAGERITDLCREFGISRKTGHKLCERFRERGPDGFSERSRRPIHSPNRTPPDIVRAILELKEQYPTWGARKLRERFLTTSPGVRVPAASTIGVILETAGLVQPRRIRRRATSSTSLKQTDAPNELWCIDFKGQFRLGNKRLCYPLTLTDHFSRYILTCEALESTQTGGVQATLKETFREHGLPDAMRSDNGSPFASSGRCGLTQLSVWLMRLGIELERIQPGHPEQNGRHERMHLTLKQDTTRPASPNMLQQQERFDAFQGVYNTERPHEALGMKTPSTLYRSSPRKYNAKPLEPLTYPLHDATAFVSACGHASVAKRHIYVGEAFAGENIGARHLEKDVWLVSFMNINIGYVDAKQKTFLPIKTNPNQVLPMSPV